MCPFFKQCLRCLIACVQAALDCIACRLLREDAAEAFGSCGAPIHRKVTMATDKVGGHADHGPQQSAGSRSWWFSRSGSISPQAS